MYKEVKALKNLVSWVKCGSVCSSEKVGDAVMGIVGNILLDSTSVSGAHFEVISEGAKPARV